MLILNRGAAALVIAGVLVRLTVRDRWPVLALLFYALPPAMLTGLACFVAWTSRRRSRGTILIWIAVALALGVSWGRTDWFRSSATPRHETVRFAFWNVCRGWAGWDNVARDINALSADVVALVEAGPATEDMRAFWKTACPGYDVSLLGGGIICLVRGESGDATVHEFDGKTQGRELELRTSGGEGGTAFGCLIVDVYANPVYSRAAALREIAEIADARTQRPLIIVGDFNTPADSVHLAALRRNHVEAFEAAGNGYAPTWPAPLPVLMLDQAWCNQFVQPVAARHGWSRCSDHRPLVLEIAVSRPKTAIPEVGN